MALPVAGQLVEHEILKLMIILQKSCEGLMFNLEGEWINTRMLQGHRQTGNFALYLAGRICPEMEEYECIQFLFE